MNKCRYVMRHLSSLWGKKGLWSHWGLIVIVLMLALPSYSHGAWTLSTRVMSTGGAIQVGSGSLQTSANGTVFKSYTTSNNVPVNLFPDYGYKISSISVNGTYLASPYPSTVSMGTQAYPGKTSQTLAASFARILIPVTSTVETPGGSVSPSGTNNLYCAVSYSFTFTPNTGSSVYKIMGLPAGATITSVSSGQPVTVFPYAGAVRATFTIPNSPVNISGAFLPLYANAGPPKTILPGTTALLQGSVKIYDDSSPVDATYAWTVKSGPAGGRITKPNASTTTFTADNVGTYTLQLQVTDSKQAVSTVTTYVTVTNSFATAGRNQCQNCHSSAGFSSVTFNAWSSSKHRALGVVCAYCHVGSDSGNHPDLLHTNTVDKNTYLFNPVVNSALGNGSFCLNGACHNPGVTHKDVMACSTCHPGGTHNTDATYAASLNVCINCHSTSPNCNFGNLSNGGSYTPDQCATCHPTVHGPRLLDHFAFANISTQQQGVPFRVSVTAQDVLNRTVVGFTGTVGLVFSNNTSVPPLRTGSFKAGVWPNEDTPPEASEVSASKPGTGITITATRTDGTEKGTSNPFTVTPAPSGYIFEWQEPLKLDKKEHAFEKGQTIPVKFKLTDSNNVVIRLDPLPKLEVMQASGENMVGDPISIPANPDGGDRFRFSEEDGLYIYNLDTSDLDIGTYHAHAVLDAVTKEMVGFGLKGPKR